MADEPFPLKVDLWNKQGSEERILLFAAAYEREEGNPCGSAADPRFRGFLHRVQPDFRIAGNARASWPASDRDLPWHQVANASAIGTDTEIEICVFAASTESGAGATLTYHDYWNFTVKSRLVNAAPTAEWSWSPAIPNATMPVRFEATGEDADGDAITFEWDFGHFGAQGRAKATGPTATHRFYPDGTFTVTLTVRDAWDATTLAKEIRVLPESEPASPPTPEAPEERAWWRIPAPAAIAAIAALGLASRLRARAR